MRHGVCCFDRIVQAYHHIQPADVRCRQEFYAPKICAQCSWFRTSHMHCESFHRNLYRPQTPWTVQHVHETCYWTSTNNQSFGNSTNTRQLKTASAKTRDAKRWMSRDACHPTRCISPNNFEMGNLKITFTWSATHWKFLLTSLRPSGVTTDISRYSCLSFISRLSPDGHTRHESESITSAKTISPVIHYVYIR